MTYKSLYRVIPVIVFRDFSERKWAGTCEPNSHDRMCNDNATLKTIVGYQIVTLQSIAAAIQHQSTITTLLLQHSVGLFFVHTDQYFAVWFLKKH